MISNISRALLVTGAVIALGACMKDPNAAKPPAANETKAAAAADQSDPTASAQSAAPASISGNATHRPGERRRDDDGASQGHQRLDLHARQPGQPRVRTRCASTPMPGNGSTPGSITSRRPQGAVGVMYMLEGGTDASNTDPYATKPTADNDWVKTGPHVMIVGSKEILAGHPSGGKPDTSVPYVMWAGTPYAHLMVPMSSRRSISAGDRELRRLDQRGLGLARGEARQRIDRAAGILAGALDRVGKRARSTAAAGWRARDPRRQRARR